MILYLKPLWVLLTYILNFFRAWKIIYEIINVKVFCLKKIVWDSSLLLVWVFGFRNNVDFRWLRIHVQKHWFWCYGKNVEGHWKKTMWIVSNNVGSKYWLLSSWSDTIQLFVVFKAVSIFKIKIQKSCFFAHGFQWCNLFYFSNIIWK